MPKIDPKRALVTFCVTFLLGAAALQFNVIGHAAYAVERAVASAIDEQLPTSAELEDLARANRLVARKALPAVVHIVTASRRKVDLPPKGRIPDWLEMLPWWDQVPQEQKKEWWDQRRRELEQHPGREYRGQGSGVIIDAQEGFILTNYHVVGEVDEIEVRLHDGRRFEGTLLGKDRMTDLAVVEIQAVHLFGLPIGDSEALEVGDPVMTVGNPFGYDGTVSKGIVSALDRSQIGIIDYEGFIQTDAVINPGNSGGPLVNMRAEIVGINTAIESTTGAFNGIGLAIPTSRVKRVLPALLKGEKVVRGYLGVEMVSAVQSPEQSKELGWSELYGVLVNRVVPNSPAQEAGVLNADILVNLNGASIESSSQLTDRVAYTTPGEMLVFDVWRNKQMVSLQVVVGRQPHGFSTRAYGFRPGQIEEPEPVEDSADLSSLGFEVETLDKELVGTYSLQGLAAQGVVVTHVDPHSDAKAKNIKPGDLIVALNGNSVSSVEELQTLLKYISRTEEVDLRLRNRKGSRHVRLEAQR